MITLATTSMSAAYVDYGLWNALRVLEKRCAPSCAGLGTPWYLPCSLDHSGRSS